MNDRRFVTLAAVAGFLVVDAFGIGVIAEAAFGGRSSQTSASGGTQAQVVEVEEGDLYIKPAELTAEPGPVEFRVTNKGAIEHNFSIEGVGRTEMIPAGGSATLSVDLEAGTYAVKCEVPGHADSGMRGTLTVGEGGGHGTTGGTTGAGTMSPQEMAAEDAAVTGRFPEATKGKGGVDLKPKILADGTKVFELTAAAVKWQTVKGTVVDGYAYNGMIPGPTLRAKLGDSVRVVLHNELPEPTVIHFHGMTVPNGMDGVPVITQDAVLPGKSFTYEFTVRNTGTNMYHSHFMAQRQVPMGLLGAFIVPDPKDPKVDADHSLVLNDGPLGFTMNGKSFPATEPIVVKRGQTLRIRYMNEGLQIHPMHLHGMSQTVIALDGHLLGEPYEQDTVMVAPGQRVDVLVRATEPGAWAFHCHILSHAESDHGMFGMVTALIVQ